MYTLVARVPTNVQTDGTVRESNREWRMLLTTEERGPCKAIRDVMHNEGDYTMHDLRIVWTPFGGADIDSEVISLNLYRRRHRSPMRYTRFMEARRDD